MLATNDIGDSVFSMETESVTTLQDGEKTNAALPLFNKTTLNAERVSSDRLLFPVFVLTSTGRAPSHPGSKTNHHYLGHGAVEGISTFLVNKANWCGL